MSIVSQKLVLKIFEAFSIERWTDLVRPFDLIEMDKCGEKMALAYIIGKFEERRGQIIDWDWMIYASLFDLFKKIALCDIKSPIQRKIKTEYPAEYRRINEWVLSQYKDIIEDEKIYKLFCAYILQTEKTKQDLTLTERIMAAAHKFSVLREFEMLSAVNEPYRLKNIERTLNGDIQPFMNLEGLQLLMAKQRPYEFLMILEQLRFQVRWNQTPRVPKTTVLGHSFFVALITLLLSRQSETSSTAAFEMCSRRRYNNYFSALFHDLPEAVTRDIISPVKQATDGLPSIVKRIEAEIVENELRPLMEDFYADELMYFTDDEFENRILVQLPDAKKNVQHVSFDDLNIEYNEQSFSPVDGRLVRLADHIAAFVEADSSIRYGITSAQLRSGRENILSLYPRGRLINGIDTGDFFALFLR